MEWKKKFKHAKHQATPTASPQPLFAVASATVAITAATFSHSSLHGLLHDERLLRDRDQLLNDLLHC